MSLRVSSRKRSRVDYKEDDLDKEVKKFKGVNEKIKKPKKSKNPKSLSETKENDLSTNNITKIKETKDTKKKKSKDIKEEPRRIPVKPKQGKNTPEMKGRVVMSLPSLLRATVVNRPSKVVKSPYMADIILEGKTEEELCHSPALGCAGLVVSGSNVLVTPKASASAKSKYSLDLVDIGSSVVGANPNFCNKMARHALENGWVQGIPKFEKNEIKSEASIDESRFDFRCSQDNMTYYIEVKGVPNACVADVKMSPLKKSRVQVEVNEAKDKIAYFPDGYRKKADEAISPRALKHVEHLTRLAMEENTKCVLLFIVQRKDCKSFQPTKNDPKYRAAVHKASEGGVSVVAHSVIWEGVNAIWGDTLPINLKDDSDEF